MAKIYITGETKQQRKARKAQEKNTKVQKNAEISVSLPQESVDVNQKRYIVCLKHGTKYSADYVNKLYNMCKRHCTLDFEFVCFTENPSNINSHITIKSLPELPIHGWWYKPMFFDPNLGLNGTILFFDLDVIIFKNIDNLFTFQPGKFCIIRDFNRSIRSDWKKVNSSVFRLESGDQSHVFTDFMKDTKNIMRRLHGDQDWIYEKVKTNWSYWPDEWVQSYKWEMRNRPRMIRDSQTGKRNWDKPGEPNIKSETSVAVFHGDPNPADCIDPWCKINWC